MGKRRTLDRYDTPPFFTRAMLAHQFLEPRPYCGSDPMTILEPCVGRGDILRVLKDYYPRARYITNDIDPEVAADYHFDAAKGFDPKTHSSLEPVDSIWQWAGPVDWVVTNPPFTQPTCLEILDNAIKAARVGVIALLRITFKEPTKSATPKGWKIPHPLYPRGKWLEEHPLSRELAMPRYSFTQDGASDSTTVCWCMWLKFPFHLKGPAILSIHQAEERYGTPRLLQQT